MAIDFTTNIDSLLTELSKEAKDNPKAGPKVSDVDFSIDIQSLYNNLANESNRISAEITSTLEDLGVDVKDDVQDIIEELSVELKKEEPKEVRSLELKRIKQPTEEVEEEPKDVTPEEVHDLVSQSAELLSTLEEVNYKPDADNEYIEDVGRLAKRIEVMQNTLAELTSVGYGQAGMTYGSGEVRLEYLDDVNRDSAKTDGMYLQYQSSSGKWIGSATTQATWDPSGYEYTGDKLLYLIENEEGAVNGLEIEENTWTQMPCGRGSSDDFLPSSFENRIWNDTLNKFSFAEVPVDGVILFRLQTWIYPETNNALLAGRIRFVAVNDGTDAILNEDGDRIVLEDDTGNITGNYIQAYSFFQTVAAQEMADGAGVEHERTFIFPIYVGNSSAQNGWGQF